MISIVNYFKELLKDQEFIYLNRTKGHDLKLTKEEFLEFSKEFSGYDFDLELEVAPGEYPKDEKFQIVGIIYN